MTTPSGTGPKADVPSQVFGQFLKALAKAGVSAGVITRLRKTLLEDKVFTDRALNAAVLSDEPLP